MIEEVFNCYQTYCVLSVNAALVMEDGRLRPLVISLHNFLLMTSTRPPLDTTSRKSSYKSRVCFAMMGILLTGVPENIHRQTRFKTMFIPIFKRIIFLQMHITNVYLKLFRIEYQSERKHTCTLVPSNFVFCAMNDDITVYLNTWSNTTECFTCCYYLTNLFNGWKRAALFLALKGR
jgi:hypothetical protein